ncbi:MAG: flagellar type III secretion system protein FlhB [Betaproteobacteria bacterium]|jgi:flagellar biosynthetic protein FlhB|uniref:Flagellar biosynthetic protein FlhB n=1 Tax=Candidatus Proximibacter danicus TaxID=2954365 RepID=A0A9D7K1Q1_9PROT|nr:flagellar type III secretion system protein FlhB [Candidatus Proximibacter danicus]MBK9446474.1 flagellar type III secretion system protein FlhB [Betaproteobacteria bacterium]
MAEDSDLERTEPASARRLEQAREEGQVPRSRELGAFLILLAAAGSIWMMGGWLVQRVMAMFRRGLMLDEKLVREPDQMLVRFADLSTDALLTFSPFLLALMIAALATPFLLNAFNFSPKALMPKLDRMDPIKGLQRLFSWTGVVELVKAVAKTAVVGGVAAGVIWSERYDLMALLAQPAEVALSSAGHLLSYSFLAMVAAMVLIVVIDVPFQLWHYHHKLKMTREELKQEGKEMEGDPQVKGRIRMLQREAARRRMMAAVPQADVIVTNPTHFAVALAYKSGMGAPRVLAKGTGEIARRIREIGAEHGVPLLEAPPLARALHRHVEIDQEIPGTLYAAVAEALAWVYQLSSWRQTGGQYPVPPRELQVPPELVPEVVNG